MKKKIGWAGTDGRTFFGALCTHFSGHEGVIIRGMPAMAPYADMRKWPLQFISTVSNSKEDYGKAINSALSDGLVDYVVLMPEDLQFNGLVDWLTTKGHGERVLGLTKAGAFIEGDKIRGKELCVKAKIPTAHWETLDLRNYEAFRDECRDYIHSFGGAVVKYPYSAGGKGARVINNDWEIPGVYDKLIKDYQENYQKKKVPHGPNGEWQALIEEKMSGTEISFTILVDKNGNFQVLPTAMDFPERFDGPPGPSNPVTGGLATISPHPAETPELLALVGEVIAKPLIEQMRALGILRPCVIYPGCFVNITSQGIFVRVCEINIRPGEPEFQSVARMVNNLGDLIIAMFTGELDKVKPQVREKHVVISLALFTGPGPTSDYRGYPWRYKKGEPMEIEFETLQKRGIMLIPSGMGYDDGRGYKSDGTRVCYLMANADVKEGEKRSDVADALKTRLVNAFSENLVRVVPEENPVGNRLEIRKTIGDQFLLAERIFT